MMTCDYIISNVGCKRFRIWSSSSCIERSLPYVGRSPALIVRALLPVRPATSKVSDVMRLVGDVTSKVGPATPKVDDAMSHGWCCHSKSWSCHFKS